ncbi:MAG TPA: copper chaperone [Actinobacteria bacterium]|nr:copper chaperone CopZ [bacterium BMS3Bbin01]HDH26831.1 copper chaperone [Actinomycetota bacterium]
MTTLTLKVPDISCGHCKTSIEGAVAPRLPGVESVEVHIEPRTVDITWDDSALNLDTITEAIEDQGYTVDHA